MKRKFFYCVIMMLLFLVGCNKKEENEVFTSNPLPATTELFRYEGTEEADVIAVDEEGYLYTATCITEIDTTKEWKTSEYVYEPFIQQFKVYDLEGNCIKEQQVGVGDGDIQFLTAKEGKLYCIVNKAVLAVYGPTLYTIDTTTWEVTEIYQFEDFWLISNFAHVGDYYYVIGNLKDIPYKEFELHPNVDYFSYNGETIARIKAGEEETKEERLPIDFPIDIVATNKDTLLIYQYNENVGYEFLEFYPEEQVIQEVGWKQTDSVLYGFVQCETGFLFLKEAQLFYGTADGREAGVFNEWLFLPKPATYQRGFVFFINERNNKIVDTLVERISIESIIKNNKTIRFLMDMDTMVKPFDCGYQMQKSRPDFETFTLKVLAQDPDFDMFLLDSKNPMAYNIKEKGAFYALNEVEGVKEYLDACFPYIKEVATKEDGSIWMIPVALNVTGLKYHKQYCEQNGIDWDTMDFSDFLALVEQVETSAPKEGSVSFYMSAKTLFRQYLSEYNHFDTDVFRTYAKQMKQLNEKTGNLFFDNAEFSELSQNNIFKFFYEQEGNVISVKEDIKKLGNTTELGITSVPKISEHIKNEAYVVLLSVNPQSENLKATLDYISDFCNYMMKQKDSFLLKDESTYTDSPYVKGWYEVYSDATIFFEMDNEVYWTTFFDYVDGEIELEEMIKEIERKRKIYMEE